MSTKIAWTNEVFNPVIGCSKVSPGCQNCYAERMACRLAHMGIRAYQDVTMPKDNYTWFDQWNGKTAFVESALYKPLHWKKPRMIFVSSMGDLFHESVPFEWIDRVMNIMRNCRQHTFQILTKRPERMLEYTRRYGLLPDNLWLGVSAENQAMLDERLRFLNQISAAVRFVSLEPMLSETNIGKYLTCANVGLEYDYEDTKKSQASGKQVDKSCSRWGVANRSTRSHLEDSKAWVGQVEQNCSSEQMQTGSGRTGHGCILDGQGDVEKETHLRLRSSAGLPVFQRGNSCRTYHQSQERDKDRQQAGESRTCELQRTGNSCNKSFGEKPTDNEPERRKELKRKANKQASIRNKRTTEKRGEAGDDCDGLRNSIPNGVNHSLKQKSSKFWIIVGCESGPRRRTCKPEWIQSVVDQCQNAEVPVFVKQIDINGKVSRNMNEWPESLRVQQWPENIKKG